MIDDAKNVLVGMSVGVSDLMFVYPLAVIACRRESGMSLSQSVRAGKYWSGATTQLVLIPYSIMVEFGTKSLKRHLDSSPFVAPLLMSVGVSAALQPFEKKLVMDQLLQIPAHKAASETGIKSFVEPLRAINAYQKTHGMRALYKGYVPLAAREFIYIASITVVNPYIVQCCDHLWGSRANTGTANLLPGIVASFSVGFTAGMCSAPFQTVNAMMKDERNATRSLPELLNKDIFSKGLSGSLHRLFYGAGTRSLRTGGAGLLYFTWRRVYHTDQHQQPVT